jgi:hypothetical protein
MKRHKQVYFIKSDRCDECYSAIMIHRKPKQKSPMRYVMWRAWWYHYIESYKII